MPSAPLRTLDRSKVADATPWTEIEDSEFRVLDDSEDFANLVGVRFRKLHLQDRTIEGVLFLGPRVKGKQSALIDQ